MLTAAADIAPIPLSPEQRLQLGMINLAINDVRKAHNYPDASLMPAELLTNFTSAKYWLRGHPTDHLSFHSCCYSLNIPPKLLHSLIFSSLTSRFWTTIGDQGLEITLISRA